MTIPLLSSQKHDSFVDKHGAALGAARSGLYTKNTPKIQPCDFESNFKSNFESNFESNFKSNFKSNFESYFESNFESNFRGNRESHLEGNELAQRGEHVNR